MPTLISIPFLHHHITTSLNIAILHTTFQVEKFTRLYNLCTKHFHSVNTNSFVQSLIWNFPTRYVVCRIFETFHYDIKQMNIQHTHSPYTIHNRDKWEYSGIKHTPFTGGQHLVYIVCWSLGGKHPRYSVSGGKIMLNHFTYANNWQCIKPVLPNYKKKIYFNMIMKILWFS